jgi:2-iminobutanoate/2-iminopropanoate deaminase
LSALSRVGFVIGSDEEPFDSAGDIIPGGSNKENERLLQNVRRHLQAAGVPVGQAVRCGCFLADMSDFAAFDRLYRPFFREALPCRTTMQAGLHGIKAETDAPAYAGT